MVLVNMNVKRARNRSTCSYCRICVLQTRTLLLLTGSDQLEDLGIYVAVILPWI
jgi:hypothetical protein